MLQVPALHPGVPLVLEQTALQPPQLEVLVAVLTSQPLLRLLSQLA